jgi:hypothetical protein
MDSESLTVSQKTSKSKAELRNENSIRWGGRLDYPKEGKTPTLNNFTP